MSDLDMPAISRLSEELIAIIVDYAVNPLGDTSSLDVRTAQFLRLTHPRFARSSSIQRLLFYKVHLSARWTRRDLRAFASIASSVKSVTFKAMQLVPEDVNQDDPFAPGYWQRQTSIWSAAKEYVNSGRAESDWIEVLRAAKNVEAVSILAPTRQWVRRRAARRRAETEPGEDRLLPLALQCLSMAGTKPSKLELHDGDVVSYIGWLNVRDWNNIDGSRLEHLKVVTGFDMACLLSICAQTLRSLQVGPNTGWAFYTEHCMGLSALEDLSLNDTSIDAKHFASWLLQCISLRRMSLHKVRLNGRQFLGAWRPVFDAIRSHPSRMHVYFSASITIAKKDALTIDHHTSHVPREPPYDTVDDRVAYELEKYISNASDWSLKEYEGLL